MEDIWKEEAKLDACHRPVASCTVTHLNAVPSFPSFNVKMPSASHKGAASAAPAASALISLAAARLTVTSCLSFPSSSGASGLLRGSSQQFLSGFAEAWFMGCSLIVRRNENTVLWRPARWVILQVKSELSNCCAA